MITNYKAPQCELSPASYYFLPIRPSQYFYGYKVKNIFWEAHRARTGNIRNKKQILLEKTFLKTPL